MVQGEPPMLSLERERALITFLTRAAADGLVQSAHDCSDGGIAVTLAECAFDTGGIGLTVNLAKTVSDVATLFGESASRAVVSVTAANLSQLEQLARELSVPMQAIGVTGGERLTISVASEIALDLPVVEAEQIWSGALGRYFARRAA